MQEANESCDPPWDRPVESQTVTRTGEIGSGLGCRRAYVSLPSAAVKRGETRLGRGPARAPIVPSSRLRPARLDDPIERGEGAVDHQHLPLAPLDEGRAPRPFPAGALRRVGAELN